MPTTFGDTRMSVMPQVYLAPIVQPAPVGEAFNSGLQGQQALAQVAENAKMQPVREQLAQVDLEAAKRNLLKPMLEPIGQSLAMRPRSVPSVYDPKSYEEGLKQLQLDAYTKAYNEAAQQGKTPDEADVIAQDYLATPSVAADLNTKAANGAWITQPDVMDQVRVNKFRNLVTGATESKDEVFKSAEQMADEAIRGEKSQWVQKAIADPSDPTGRTSMWVNYNTLTGETRPIGGDVAGTSLAAVRQSQVDRNIQLNDVSKETEASRRAYADLNGGVVPPTAQIQAWANAAAKEGVSVPTYLRVLHSSNPLLLNAYFKTVMTSGPIAANAQYPAQAKEGTEMMAAIKRDEDAILASRQITAPAGGAADIGAAAVGVPGMNTPAAVPSIAFQSTATPSRAAPVAATARTWNAPTVADAQSLVTSGMAKEGDKVVVGNQSFTVKNTAGGR